MAMTKKKMMFAVGVVCCMFAVANSDPIMPDIFGRDAMVLFIGDSITHGGRQGDMNHYLGHGYQAEIAMRYLAYRPEWRLQFANRGISGDTSAKLVARWGRDAMPFTANANGESGVFGWVERAKEFAPDVLSILVGINDYRHKGDNHVSVQDYERNLRFMVTNSVAVKPSVRIVLCEPFSLLGEKESDFMARQAIVRKVASDYNLAFVPFQRLFSERLLKLYPNRRYWFWDAYHPTYAAHMHMADFWLETVAAEFAKGKGVVCIDPDVVKCRQWIAERWSENDSNGNPIGERGAPFPIDVPLPWLEKDNYDWFSRHESRVELAKKTNPQIVFIGDSITHGWEMNDQRGNAMGVFNYWFGKYATLNLGFGWDRIQNVLWRLEHGEMDGTNPKVVVIHIGTNNTAPGYKYNAAPNPPGEVADGILAVCRKVRDLAPNARIVLMKVFPRGKTPEDPYRGKVAAVNAELDRRLADFLDDKLTVLDMYDKFVDKEGNISLDLTIDYLHPTAKGYDLWAETLAPIVEAECGTVVECRPETWFHIIGGNASKEGSAADIAAIAEAGIGGIQFFHGGWEKDEPWPGVTNMVP